MDILHALFDSETVNLDGIEIHHTGYDSHHFKIDSQSISRVFVSTCTVPSRKFLPNLKQAIAPLDAAVNIFNKCGGWEKRTTRMVRAQYQTLLAAKDLIYKALVDRQQIPLDDIMLGRRVALWSLNGLQPTDHSSKTQCPT